MATILNNVGGLYRTAGDLENALIYLQKGLEIYEKLHDPFAIASQFSNMALVTKEMGNNDEAIRLYQQSLEIFEKMNHSYSKTIEDEIQKLLNHGNIWKLFVLGINFVV